MAKQKRKHRSLPRLSPAVRKWGAFAVLAVVVAAAIYFGYRLIGPNTVPFSDHEYFYIRTGSGYRDVVGALEQQHIVRNIGSFEWVAKKMDYPRHVHAGRYRIKKGMSNVALVRLLRSGRQSPVRLVITKLRTKADFAAFVSHRLEADSAVLMALLDDQVYLRQFGLDTNTALSAVIPNTYQFFWNTSAEGVFTRLVREKDRFWTPRRRAEADSLGLSPTQVYILASIVEEETNKARDKPLVASVYLNRLHAGMPLAADPTARYAAGDFGLQRITSRQTAVKSPYNTYLHTGLPPGPICTPSIRTIEAVLHAPATSYYYFCARPDFSGYNAYARTYRQHLRNARAYQKALDSLGIH
jgi:UPF0755 protein